jgi:hypothetical protein
VSLPGSISDWQGKDLIKVFTTAPTQVSTESQCTAATRSAIHDWAVDYFNRAAKVSIKWNNIDDLYAYIWASDNVLDERFVLARVLEMHATDYLFIIHDAFRAKRMGYFTEDEYAMWRAYIDDLGQSPFFLLALKDGAEFGYMMPDVLAEMREYIATRPEIKCVVSALYPSFFDANFRDHLSPR